MKIEFTKKELQLLANNGKTPKDFIKEVNVLLKNHSKQTHCLPGKHLGLGIGHDVCEVCGKNTYS